jgi:hypothetical protein
MFDGLELRLQRTVTGPSGEQVIVTAARRITPAELHGRYRMDAEQVVAFEYRTLELELDRTIHEATS